MAALAESVETAPRPMDRSDTECRTRVPNPHRRGVVGNAAMPNARAGIWPRRVAEPYGVLRGRPAAALDDRADLRSPHYHVLVRARNACWRVAVNVRSRPMAGAPEHASIVLYRLIDGFHHPITRRLETFAPGFTVLPSRPDSGALDFVRGALFRPGELRLLPPDLPGHADDLNDLLAEHVQAAIRDETAELFAFGMAWGPDPQKDPVFLFRPGRGIHNVHMNQGNPRGFHDRDNGIWRDGGLLLRFAATERWVAIFLAFQSQSWLTDDRTGFPISG